MHLCAVVSASPRDEDRDDLSFVYAFDRKQKYCVSLARQPGSDHIELMVGDQLCAKVSDLSVALKGQNLIVNVPPSVASALDGTTCYELEVINLAEMAPQLSAALEVIFVGKQGLTLIAG